MKPRLADLLNAAPGARAELYRAARREALRNIALAAVGGVIAGLAVFFWFR